MHTQAFLLKGQCYTQNLSDFFEKLVGNIIKRVLAGTILHFVSIHKCASWRKTCVLQNKLYQYQRHANLFCVKYRINLIIYFLLSLCVYSGNLNAAHMYTNAHIFCHEMR